MTANFCMAFAFYVLTPLLPLYLSEHFSAGKDKIGLQRTGGIGYYGLSNNIATHPAIYDTLPQR